MKKPKILIVDDEVMSTRLYSFYLQSYDVDIIIAYNGKDAMELVRENTDIDIVFMNYMMPIMDGLESTVEIRKFNKDIIIIMTSAAIGSYNDLEKRAIESGCNYCMSLPLRLTQMVEKIEQYLNTKLIKK